VPYYKTQSIFAALRLLGSPVAVAYALQGGALSAAAALTVATWRRSVDQDFKSAVLATAGLLATPFVLDYDLTQLALPAAWLLRHAARIGALLGEAGRRRSVCHTLRLAPGADKTHLALAPLAEAALLLVLMARIRLRAAAFLTTARAYSRGVHTSFRAGERRNTSSCSGSGVPSHTAWCAWSSKSSPVKGWTRTLRPARFNISHGTSRGNSATAKAT
jgi:hypothetical protein